VRCLGFAADGRSLFTSESSRARAWDAPPPLPDGPPRLSDWIEAATGLALDGRGVVRVLDRDARRERRRQLEALGARRPPTRRRGWIRSSTAATRRPGATP
jgi:hypothetical protein